MVDLDSKLGALEANGRVIENAVKNVGVIHAYSNNMNLLGLLLSNGGIEQQTAYKVEDPLGQAMDLPYNGRPFGEILTDVREKQTADIAAALIHFFLGLPQMKEKFAKRAAEEISNLNIVDTIKAAAEFYDEFKEGEELFDQLKHELEERPDFDPRDLLEEKYESLKIGQQEFGSKKAFVDASIAKLKGEDESQEVKDLKANIGLYKAAIAAPDNEVKFRKGQDLGIQYKDAEKDFFEQITKTYFEGRYSDHMAQKLRALMIPEKAQNSDATKQVLLDMVNSLFDKNGKEQATPNEQGFIRLFEQYYDISRRGTMANGGLIGDGNPAASQPNQSIASVKGDYDPWFDMTEHVARERGFYRQITKDLNKTNELLEIALRLAEQ